MVVEALRHFDGRRYELCALVVMNDHVHVVVRPLSTNQLEKIIWSWKSYTANQFQRKMWRAGRVWQDEYFDRVVRDEAELFEKVNYILKNPWKRWPEAIEYPWVWAEGIDAKSD